MKRHYMDCKTCGGRVELTNRPAENGKRTLSANCHGMWTVVIAGSPPTFEETQGFLRQASCMPENVPEYDIDPSTPTVKGPPRTFFVSDRVARAARCGSIMKIDGLRGTVIAVNRVDSTVTLSGCCYP